MPSAAELGISEQDYQDAINLETLMSLSRDNGDSCAECGRSPVVFADCGRAQFLCRSCGNGKANCKNIHEQAFKKHEVDKFSAKFGSSGKSAKRSTSYAPTKSSTGKKRGKQSKKRRDDSSTEESDGSEPSEESYHPKRKNDKNRNSQRREPRKSHHRQASAESDPFNFDSFENKNVDEFMRFPAGMAGLQRRQNMLLQQNRPLMSGGSRYFPQRGDSMGYGTQQRDPWDNQAPPPYGYPPQQRQIGSYPGAMQPYGPTVNRFSARPAGRVATNSWQQGPPPQPGRGQNPFSLGGRVFSQQSVGQGLMNQSRSVFDSQQYIPPQQFGAGPGGFPQAPQSRNPFVRNTPAPQSSAFGQAGPMTGRYPPAQLKNPFTATQQSRPMSAGFGPAQSTGWSGAQTARPTLAPAESQWW